MRKEQPRKRQASDGEANGKWKRPANRCGAFSSFVDLTGQLAQRTKDNSALRIFAAAGDNDLVTSYVTMKYMLEHSGIASEHLTINDYPGGHMMYLQVQAPRCHRWVALQDKAIVNSLRSRASQGAEQRASFATLRPFG